MVILREIGVTYEQCMTAIIPVPAALAGPGMFAYSFSGRAGLRQPRQLSGGKADIPI
jgi:hypothetical protein